MPKHIAVAAFLLLTTAGAIRAQKIDNWAVNNAGIGPGSPIEIAPGSSFSPRVEYPNPDGPMSPLQAKIVWSINPPVEGISIDPVSGKITVASSVAPGTTATVFADINSGVRKVSAKMIVFNPAENPLHGDWIVQSIIACDDSQKLSPSASTVRLNEHFKFYVDHKIWAGRPFGIAATTRFSGDYQFDPKSAVLKIIPTWPRGRPAEQWKVEMVSELELELSLPSPPPKDDKATAAQVCGYVLVRDGTR